MGVSHWTVLRMGVTHWTARRMDVTHWTALRVGVTHWTVLRVGVTDWTVLRVGVTYSNSEHHIPCCEFLLINAEFFLLTNVSITCERNTVSGSSDHFTHSAQPPARGLLNSPSRFSGFTHLKESFQSKPPVRLWLKESPGYE